MSTGVAARGTRPPNARLDSTLRSCEPCRGKGGSPLGQGNLHPEGTCMYVVVNHLRFRDPVSEATVQAFRDGVRLTVDSGGLAERRIFASSRGSRHPCLTLTFASSGRPQDATVPRVSSLGLRREKVCRQDIRSDPNQTLAEILAAVQPRDRTRCLLDSVEDVLSIADLSVAHPALEFPQCLGTALNMVKDEKTLQSSV